VEFRLLGTIEVESGGVELTPARPKQRALLALLLLRVGEVVATDDLVEALWGESPPPTAPTALQGHISALRKVLGAERIETQPSGYRLRLLDGDELDLRRFIELAQTARGERGPVRAQRLADAVALFRGEPLADFRYEAFAAPEIARLDELRLAALEDQLETELELGRELAAIPRLEALIAGNRHRERLWAQLMLALYRTGRQAEALQAFREASAALLDELGLEPGPMLRTLERQILNHDARLAAPDAFVTVGPRVDVDHPAGIATWVCVDHARSAAPVRAAVGQRGGVEVDAPPDSVLAGFARVRDAVAATRSAMQATAGLARIGIHAAESPEAGMRGATAVCRAAHEGQILLSQTARDLFVETPLSAADLRDLGRHRLQDLAPPWRLFQLTGPDLRDNPSPPRSLDTYPTNLPLQPALLVGRSRELRELTELIRRPEVRLVTLSGAAGIGKTRLAVQTAATLLDEFDDGVFFADLATLADPDLALESIASTLGLAEQRGPTTERIAAHLRGHGVLAVLDNLEQLLELAPALKELVAGTSRSKLLVTSRVSLGPDVGHEYLVQPLQAPPRAGSAETMRRVESVALFVSRARSTRPDFELSDDNAAAVGAICRAVDGLPLAIELAASRVSVLAPSALLLRLDQRLKLLKRGAGNVADRHRTLRAAIDWSYDLLDDEQRQLLSCLAVFNGGFSLQAVETICDGAIDVVDGLATLVDANLVRSGGTDEEPRFSLLETMREYAAERLETFGGVAEVRRRHAAYFLELAERAEPHLRESPGERLDLLEREQDNLRTALARFDVEADTGGLIRLAGALWRFWYLRGQLAEGRRWLELALARDPVPTPARAKALLGLSVMAGNQGDYAAVRRHAAAALEVSRTVGDEWTAAYATHMLGNALRGSRELVEAQQLLEESAAAFRRLGDEHSALLVARNLARLLEERGDADAAHAIHQDNLERARAMQNPRIEASTLGALAMIAADDGRHVEALAMLRQSVTIHRELRDLLDSAVDLSRCAFLLAQKGRLEAAARLLYAFESLDGEIGTRRLWVAERNEQTRIVIEQQLAADALTAAREEALSMTLDDALALALSSL